MEDRAQSERNWAVACHLAAFTGFVVPFGNLLGPLVVWLLKRDDFPLVDDQGKESMNFQISVTLYFLGLLVILFGAVTALALASADGAGARVPVFVTLLTLSGVLLGLLGISELVLVIVASVRAASGERFRYPLTLRLLR